MPEPAGFLRPEDLLRLNLALTVDLGEGDLIGERSGADPEEAPRLFVSRLAEGYLVLCHRGLSRATRERVRSEAARRLWESPERVRELLATEPALERPWLDTGPPLEGLYFDADPGPASDPEVVERDRGFEIHAAGGVASRAFSIRESLRSAELAVRTEPEFRRRGWATRVARAWAHSVLASGRVAFYSFIHGNEESRRLAERLGVRWYASTYAYY